MTKPLEEKRKYFAGLYLLEQMANDASSYPLLLEGDDKYLESIFENLLSNGEVEIQDDKYLPTEKGRETVTQFLGCYRDFLKNFDVYSAVDLKEGSFAFAKYWEYDDDEKWRTYLEQDRWEDLRIAVATFKHIESIEVVFMNFLSEGRFTWNRRSGWQFDLLLGSVWDEIQEITDTAIQIKDLGYEDDGEWIDGERVIRDIIEQGAVLNKKLWAEEDNRSDEWLDRRKEVSSEMNGTEPFSNDIYDDYLDPNYASPYWRR